MAHLLRRAVVLRLEGKRLRCLRVAEVASSREVGEVLHGRHVYAEGRAVNLLNAKLGFVPILTGF